MTNPSSKPSHAAAPRWNREQILAARIVPLLQRRGLILVEHEAGNFELPTHPGLLLKDSYWRWPERNQAGNAIDLFTQVFGMNFHDAMRAITGTCSERPPPTGVVVVRRQCGWNPREKQNHPATTAKRDARCPNRSVRCQRGKTPPLGKTQPTPSHAYDASASIWARNTTAIRDKTSNRYDASSGQSTMGKKDVTGSCAEQAMSSRAHPEEKPAGR